MAFKYTRDDYARVAEDTIKIINSGKYSVDQGTVNIRDQLKYSVENTVLYKPTYRSVKLPPNPKWETEIEIVYETTLSGCKRLKGYSTVALNFASAKHPGGGFKRGSNAQEESLMRASGLYICINDENSRNVTSEMYEYNRNDSHKGIYSDYMIYSPNVPIFRDDDEKLVPQNDIYYTSFITAPAVNTKVALEKGVSEDAIENSMRHRINLILSVAVNHGHDAILLGAYGCGVFGGDLESISTIFHNFLTRQYNGYFKRITFSIFDNYTCSLFRKTFFL